MRTHSRSKKAFLIPRIGVALCFFLAAGLLAVYSFAGSPLARSSGAAQQRISGDVTTEAQPPFPQAENTVTVGGLTLQAKMFATAGKVAPGENFPIVLIYDPGTTTAAGVTITVTLHSSSTFVSSIPAPTSGNGTAGSPLVYTFTTVAPVAPGEPPPQISIEAQAKDLAADPEIMWKDISAHVTVAANS